MATYREPHPIKTLLGILKTNLYEKMQNKTLRSQSINFYCAHIRTIV